jgi:hypothetical protein
MPVPVVSVPAWTSRSSWTRPGPGRPDCASSPAGSWRPGPGTRGVPLDAASVMARRSEGVPEVHITEAAGRLLEHLAATEPDPLNNGSAFMALARTGAQAIVTRIKTEAASQHVC